MGQVDALLERIEGEGIKSIDLRFTDLAGRWRHTTLDGPSLERHQLDYGLLIDGSAVPGWRDVSEADLLLKPDLTSAFADPFAAQPTLCLIADGAEPATGMGYERDPRSAAHRAEAYLAESGVADACRLSMEIGLFLFDDVRIERGPLRAAYALDSSEARTAGGAAYAGGNSGHRPAPSAAQACLPPADHHSDIRAEITTTLRDLGLPELRHEHGPSASQHRVMVGKSGLVEMADRLQLTKYVTHQVAASYGKSASFMAKPIADEPGAPLYLSYSFWTGGKPLFAGQGYADLSQLCLQFTAGILAHARALNAFTNPTTNSYRRLQPTLDEATLLTFAAHNRSAAIRIPYADRPDRKRVEIRFPDPGVNPYLALTAVLMAGLDGIARKLEPGDAMDRNLYDLRPEELEGIPSTCRTLDAALDALEADHDFLMRNDVMSAELIDAYMTVKRAELDHLARLPTPAEFELYYGL
jgi:glutamine synthetase